MSQYLSTISSCRGDTQFSYNRRNWSAERIDKLGKHPLAGVSRLWVASASWIWFVRVASIFMFLGTCFALILALLSLAGFVTLPLIHFTDTQLPEHPGAGYSKAMEMENGVRLVMKIAKLPARGP
jgi:hypothetical protein